MRRHRALLFPALLLGAGGCAPVPERVAVVAPAPPPLARDGRGPRYSRVVVLAPVPPPPPVAVILPSPPPPPIVFVAPPPPPDRPNGQPSWWPCMLGDRLC